MRIHYFPIFDPSEAHDFKDRGARHTNITSICLNKMRGFTSNDAAIQIAQMKTIEI